MNRSERALLLVKSNGNPPAEASAIQQFQTESGFRLPIDYAQFLQAMNVGEGFVGNSYAK
jgi:hypothetical protein